MTRIMVYIINDHHVYDIKAKLILPWMKDNYVQLGQLQGRDLVGS